MEEHYCRGVKAVTVSPYNAVQEPTEDLLTWCQRVTAGYGGLKVTNLTTSWRNGMAFCALLHSFHPQLVDMDSLSPHDIAGNCKKVGGAPAVTLTF